MHRRERRLRDGTDDRGDIPGPVRAQGIEISTGVVKQPRGDRNSNVLSEPSRTQHRLDECATDPSISVGERMDCFKLRMSDRGLGKHGKINSIGEGNKVVHERGDAVLMGRDKLCGVRPKTPATDPDLLVTPVTDDVRIALLKESAMHLQDGVAVDRLRQGKCRLHRSDVADDELRILRGVLTELRQGDLPSAAREVLNFGAGGTLGSKENGRKWCSDLPHFCIEAGKLAGCLFSQRMHLAVERYVEIRDQRGHRRQVRT